MRMKPLKPIKTCPCGGKICVGERKSAGKELTHQLIRCRKCGAWYGGITRKNPPKGEK